MQDLLPAGGLRLFREGVEPSGSLQKVSVTFPSSFSGLCLTLAQFDCKKTANGERVSPHVVRHTAAMELLQSGVEPTMIALWLGHESIKTTQTHLDTHLALKEAVLAKMMPINVPRGRFKPDDELLQFCSRQKLCRMRYRQPCALRAFAGHRPNDAA